MGGTPLVGKSRDEESTQGVLFRLGTRAGLLVFAGVMVVAVQRGMDPALALVRALVALLVVVACGWAAEQIARPHRPAVMEEPAAEESNGEQSAVGSEDEPGTRPAAA